MDDARMVRYVGTFSPAMIAWLDRFAAAGAYSTRAEALRELVRRAMADPDFFVDGDMPKAHDEKAVLATGGRS